MQKLKQKYWKLRSHAKALAHYALGLDNAAGFKNNLVYEFYHWVCRYNYKRLNALAPKAAVLPSTRLFKKNGFYVQTPIEEVVQAVDSLPKWLWDKLDDPCTKTKFDYLRRYNFKADEFDVVRPLLTPAIDAMIQQVFGSYYVITSVGFARTNASKDAPRSSWMWHIDDHPDAHLKVFYYLNDTYKTNGALQSHDRPHSRMLKRRGFHDRRDVPGRIVPALNDPNKYRVIEGLKGTVIFFSDNNVHRAVIPESHYRDIIVFEMLPTPNPKLEYLDRHVSYWQNPLDLLYPKPGVEIKVGAYE